MKLRHESRFAAWIRAGDQSALVVRLSQVSSLETKFSVSPDRLLDGIIDDALSMAVSRLNSHLPDGVSIDISAVARWQNVERLHQSGLFTNICRFRSARLDGCPAIPDLSEATTLRV